MSCDSVVTPTTKQTRCDDGRPIGLVAAVADFVNARYRQPSRLCQLLARDALFKTLADQPGLLGLLGLAGLMRRKDMDYRATRGSTGTTVNPPGPDRSGDRPRQCFYLA